MDSTYSLKRINFLLRSKSDFDGPPGTMRAAEYADLSKALFHLASADANSWQVCLLCGQDGLSFREAAGQLGISKIQAFRDYWRGINIMRDYLNG